MLYNIVRTIDDQKVRFCNNGCKECFEEDLSRGVRYPPQPERDKHGRPRRTTTGRRPLVTRERASILYHHCAYCQASFSTQEHSVGV